MATKTTARRTTAVKKTAATRGKQTSRTKTAAKTKARNTRSATSTRARSGSRTANAAQSSQITTDHDEIRQWVEERGGYPATVSATATNDEAGVLRIDYPGYSGQGTLERISWDEFFDKFDEAGLAFLYQEETKAGEPSRFSKLVARDETKSNTRR